MKRRRPLGAGVISVILGFMPSNLARLQQAKPYKKW